MSDGGIEVMVAGERLVLLAERAAYWTRTRTLLVADPHFGKAATFRALGIPVPRGTTTQTLQRLDASLERSHAERILFLGDFLHAKEGRAAETLRVINEWRSRHALIDMILVRGNHDARAGDPPRELNVRCVDGPLLEAPFAFAHHPVRCDSGYVIAGHIHPGARLTGFGGEHTRLPCFWFRSETAVLPAFGEFTGLADITAEPGDRVWVVAGSDVIAV